MDPETYRQAVVDDEYLKLLSVGYWVSGGLNALFSLYFLFYVALGAVFVLTPTTPSESSPPAAIGWVFVIIGVVGFVLALVFAILKVGAGFWLRSRKHRVAVMVLGGISCLELPYGTLLGVFTFMTLGRPSVATLFDAPWVAPAGAPSPPPAPATGTVGPDGPPPLA